VVMAMRLTLMRRSRIAPQRSDSVVCWRFMDVPTGIASLRAYLLNPSTDVRNEQIPHKHSLFCILLIWRVGT